MYFTTTFFTVATLFSTFTSAVPITVTSIIEPRQVEPAGKAYFAVTNFSWSKTSSPAASSSQYTFNVTFPQYVQISNVPADQPVYAVPGFKDSVNCTGTSTSTSSNGLTPVTVCTQPKNKNMKVTSQMDVNKGTLFLTYTYNVIINGNTTPDVYTGNQTALKPVDVKHATAFNVTVTSGPGVSY